MLKPASWYYGPSSAEADGNVISIQIVKSEK